MAITIHMMTPTLAQGDAIGNYIQSLARILGSWGCEVRLYADILNPRFPLKHDHTSSYVPTGDDILWMHYSIASPNLALLHTSPDYIVLDMHHVCPPHLFHGYDAYLEHLCAEGMRQMGDFVEHVDLAIAHTEYVRGELLALGYRIVRVLPLIVDTDRFSGAGDPAWEAPLASLEYLLFVGRIVPQKGLHLALDIFAEVARRRPQAAFLLAGGRQLTRYTEELEDHVRDLGLGGRVQFLGAIPEPEILTSLYRHARFYLCVSEWESFCVPIVEAQFFGTPVLGRQVPPIPEVMGPGGVILEGDAAAMGAQIASLWDDPGGYAALQKSGAKRVELFTESALGAALLDLFRERGLWR